MAVHVRHVDVGEHGGVAATRPRRQRVDAVLRTVGSNPQQLELEHEHLTVHGVIFDHQDARALAWPRGDSRQRSGNRPEQRLERRVRRRRMKRQRHSEGRPDAGRALDGDITAHSLG